MESMEEQEAWSRISIRISSVELTAAAIDQRIGIADAKLFEKGELISARNPNGKRRDQALWIRKGPKSLGADVALLLQWAEDFLKTNQDSIKQIMHQCEIDVFFGFRPSSELGSIFVVPPSFSRMLFELSAELLVDVYP